MWTLRVFTVENAGRSGRYYAPECFSGVLGAKNSFLVSVLAGKKSRKLKNAKIENLEKLTQF